MNTSKNQVCKVAPGTIITGKWHHKSYRIIKSLGYGATGIVYLAEGNMGLVALKISDDSMAITSEVNVLRHFSKVQGCLGPSLLDVDDWIRPGYSKGIPFYVMEYLKGTDFLTFVKENKNEWLGILMLQLLADLDRLHQEGWVFGDLKPDNLLVVGPPPRVRWLDVGGTTIQGRSIKEFTEFYDRGYWGLGSRKAEPSYDLFAVSMIMLNAAYPNRFSKKSQGENHLPQLINAIHSMPILRKYEKVMIRAIQGRYGSAQEMRHELLQIMSSQSGEQQTVPSRHNMKQSLNTNKPKITRQLKRKRKFRGIIETLIISIFLIIAYFLYLAGQIM